MSVRTSWRSGAIEAETARLLSYRVITMQNRGLVPNHEVERRQAVRGGAIQRVAATGVKIAGLYGQLDRGRRRTATRPRTATRRTEGRYMRSYLQAVSATIAGGTSEVKRNIIATRGLGLPRD